MLARTRTVTCLIAIVALAGIPQWPPPARAGGSSLDAAVVQVAEQLAPGIRARRASIAIPDLTNLDGRGCVLGRYLAEDLVTALFGLGVQVVERRLLDRAFSELQLGLTDLMDPAEAKRFGQLVGATTILVGTLTDLGVEVKLNVRVVEVETGHVVGAAAVVIANDEQVSRMLRQPVVARPPVPIRAGRSAVAPLPNSTPREGPAGRSSGVHLYRGSTGRLQFSDTER